MQQCFERNRAAVGREIASRMQRLQFYDYDEVGRPMNLINLQDRYVKNDQFLLFYILCFMMMPQLFLRTREDCHLLINQIKSDIVNRSLWEDELRKLLNKYAHSIHMDHSHRFSVHSLLFNILRQLSSH